MNKRAIAILGAIFLLIVITLIVLIVQKKGSSKTPTTDTTPTPTVVDTTPTPTDTDTPPVDTPPVTTGSQAVKLSDDQVISPSLLSSGTAVAYMDATGNLYNADLQISSTGTASLVNKKSLGLPPQDGIRKVIWPQAGSNLIAEFQTNGKKTWSVYVRADAKFVRLPDQVTSVQWLPSGDKILYIWQDSNGKSTLNIADADNTNWQAIADIWENDDDIVISPDGQSILYYRTQNSDAKNQIVLTTPDGKLFKGLVKDGYNYGVQWAPDSRKFVFGRRDAPTQAMQLWEGDIITGQTMNLGVVATVDKVAWSKDSSSVYAAVAREGSTSNGLSQDTIYKIDVSSAEKKEYDPGSGIDARNLFLDDSGTGLLFKNFQDGGLYYLDVSN